MTGRLVGFVAALVAIGSQGAIALLDRSRHDLPRLRLSLDVSTAIASLLYIAVGLGWLATTLL